MATGLMKVLVLFGGRSEEHEISLLSARFVVEALDRSRFEPLLVGIGKDGRWSLQSEAWLSAAPRDARAIRLEEGTPSARLEAALGTGSSPALLVVEGRAPSPVDVVFPVLHGPMGEDGSLQGLLEHAGVPYVGAGVLGSAVGMDKDVMKRLLTEAGLPQVPYRTVRRRDYPELPHPSATPAQAEEARTSRQALLDALAPLGLPAFVKPANLGSSVGVRRAKTRAELEEALDYAFTFDRKVVVEAGLASPREIECAVLGNDDARASIAGEIVVDHPDGFYSYAAKYLDEKGAVTRIPARLSPEELGRVQRLALRTFEVLECAGLARVDFFLDADGGLWVNEINTLPGFTAVSMYPKLWEASGVGGRELVSTLLDLARS